MLVELTSRQLAFVRAFVANGGRGAEAARSAGYSEKNAARYAHDLREKPHVAEAIKFAQRRAFTELASIATAQAQAMLADPHLPAGAKVSLITAVWDRAGLTPQKGTPEEQGPTADMRTWTVEQLERFLYEVEAKRRDPVTIIDVTPEPQVEPILVRGRSCDPAGSAAVLEDVAVSLDKDGVS